MEWLFMILIGLVCIVIGITNRKGNLSSIHSYHYKRVTQEDRIPFGKLVGLGTIIVGVGIVLMGVCVYFSQRLGQPMYNIIGTIVAIVGVIVGTGISIYAMIKYNKGIF